MRVKLTLSYDGTNYCGWQVQPNGITVQETVENAVEAVTGEKVRVTGSGRTDAGVHAEGQVAHFDTTSSVPADKFFKALNVHLPNDVKVLCSEEVEQTFHACNSAKRKTYEYSLYYAQTELPLKERYAVKLDRKPDIDKIKECAKTFLGEHDFRAFCASGSGAKTTRRTIYDLSVEERDGQITIAVTGNGFLYNMVRIMVGSLLSVGNGEIEISDVQKMLELGERQKNVRTLPAKALCLKKVEY